MIRYPILALVAALCAAAPAGAAEPQPVVADDTAGQTIGGPFMLVDQNGASVTDEDFAGAFMLIAFGYTNCPDICPTTLMTIAGAMNGLGPEAAKVRPIFISVDPARDTPERLQEYVGSFGPSFVGLTGPEPFVANVAKKYGVTFAKVADPSGGYSVDHTAGIFLMGPDGAFIERFSYDISAKELAASIREKLRAPSQ
jgi:protein SCO1/2